MIKYKVTYDYMSEKHSIVKVEVESETKCKITIDGTQYPKRTQYEANYFDTFKEAKSFVLQDIQSKIEHISSLIFEHRKVVASYVKKSSFVENLSEGDIC